MRYEMSSGALNRMAGKILPARDFGNKKKTLIPYCEDIRAKNSERAMAWIIYWPLERRGSFLVHYEMGEYLNDMYECAEE